MIRRMLPLGFVVLFALAMAMAPSSFGVGLNMVGTPSQTINQVECEAVPNVTHEFFRDGRAHYAIPGSCLVRKTHGKNSIVKYYVDGNWTPNPGGITGGHATETGRIYGLGNIDPKLFQPGDPNDPNNYTTFVVGLSCMGDPWLSDVACTLLNFAAPDELLEIFPNIKGGPFALTKGAIPASQRPALLAEYKRATGQFVGPPVVSPSVLKSVPGFAATRPQPPPPNPYGATYAPGAISSLTRGQTKTVQVTITNTGLLTWTPSGPNPFNLSYHWYKASTVPPGTAPAGAVVWDGPRFLVPQTVGTNQPVTITARVTAPSTPGTYVLKWDMAHEGLAWFSGKGVPTGDQTVVVK